MLTRMVMKLPCNYTAGFGIHLSEKCRRKIRRELADFFRNGFEFCKRHMNDNMNFLKYSSRETKM